MPASPDRGPSPGLLAGTLVLTHRGQVAVEALHPGDAIATRSGGMRPVRWIGTTSLFTLGAGPLLAPVRIRAGAFGAARPTRDLQIAPGHALLLGGRLVRAHLLVNGTTIRQPPLTGEIRTLHVDLGGHDCLLANGAWAETAHPALPRDTFDNAADYRARFPAAPAAAPPTVQPCVTGADDPALPALRALVAAHAPQPPPVHLLADGVPIPPAPGSPPGTWRFAVPEGTATLRLRSLAASPAEAFGRTDIRRLGLRLRAIAFDRAGATRVLDLAAPHLTDGWHQPEPAGNVLWRWTNGDAAIPLALPGPAILTLHGYALLEAPLPASSAA